MTTIDCPDQGFHAAIGVASPAAARRRGPGLIHRLRRFLRLLVRTRPQAPFMDPNDPFFRAMAEDLAVMDRPAGERRCSRRNCRICALRARS